MHLPIYCHDLTLSFPHKTCFEDFTTTIHSGDRIALIGRNGQGKSMLLKMLEGSVLPYNGEVIMPPDAILSYVPQLITAGEDLSGGQRFNAALTEALARDPDILILDEPSNHLDQNHRARLLRLLRNYSGTLVIATHDTQLLEESVDLLWHIDQGKIHVFQGRYSDYRRELSFKKQRLEQEIGQLKRDQAALHRSVMQEQHRAAQSNKKGEKSIDQRKWPTIVSKEKARRACETAGRNQAAMRDQRNQLLESLSELYQPEEIQATFSITAKELGERTCLQIYQGQVGYRGQSPVLKNLHFTLGSKARVAIRGDNGSGKTSLVKAILNDANILRAGEWQCCLKPAEIGYLDQHYDHLETTMTVIDTLALCWPQATQPELRCHLNRFLFRKNEEVNTRVEYLSGGERARLVLAMMAAKTPQLLILDEITNNLDLETKQHVIQVISAYPGALLVISHETDFLEQIGIQEYWDL